MPASHRQDDARSCGATTIVEGQDFCYCNGKLWAVENDPETHGEGRLVSVVGSTVFINGKKVIVLGDHAGSDNALHNPPSTYPSQASSSVYAYEASVTPPINTITIDSNAYSIDNTTITIDNDANN